MSAPVWSGTLLPALAAGICGVLLAWLALQAGGVWRDDLLRRAGDGAREHFLSLDPALALRLHFAAMGLGALGVLAASGSVVAALMAAIVLAALPRVMLSWARRRRRRAFDAQLPDALMMLAGAMRAGVGMSSALQQLVAEAGAPLGQEFALMLREQRVGMTLDQSLGNLEQRMPTPGAALVVAAMRIVAETGGGLADVLERTAATLRARQQMEGKIAALTAQGVMQAWVVGLLPLALMAVLQAMQPRAMWPLWHTPAGWIALGGMAMLEALGVRLILGIVNIDI